MTPAPGTPAFAPDSDQLIPRAGSSPPSFTTNPDSPKRQSSMPPPLPQQVLPPHPPPSDPRIGSAIHPAWQRIWLRAQSRPWVTLAVVAAGKHAVDPTFRLAASLARLSEELAQPIVCLDGRGVDLRTTAGLQMRMRALSSRGTRALCVLQSPTDNPVSVPIAQSADAVILCILIGDSKVVTAEQTIEQIGRERFLGAVILRP